MSYMPSSSCPIHIPFCFRALSSSLVNMLVLRLFFVILPHLHCSSTHINHPSSHCLYSCSTTSISCLVVVGGSTTIDPHSGALNAQFIKKLHCKTAKKIHPLFQSYQVSCVLTLHMFCILFIFASIRHVPCS